VYVVRIDESSLKKLEFVLLNTEYLQSIGCSSPKKVLDVAGDKLSWSCSYSS
jgi:hypothetical protein